MKFVKSFEISSMSEEQVAKIKPGQYVTVFGEKARFCGVTKAGVQMVANLQKARSAGKFSYNEYMSAYFKVAKGV